MNLQNLFKNRTYPGRFILLGKIKKKYVGVYGVTGRSESSRNRIYKKKGNKICGVQTTKEFGGNKDLLEYPAAIWSKQGLIIANGNQIKNTKTTFPIEKNLDKLKIETVEPDKYLTPRITGFISKNNSKVELGLQIIRSLKNKVNYDYFVLKPKDNEMYFISTYSGKDVRPTPSFSGKPILVKVNSKNLEEATRYVFECIKPKKGKEDYRVTVLGVEFSENIKSKILNKLEM